MTPLVAGIALTGKAPVYENVYMSGLKQKAAGEAAKAKERSKQFDDIRAGIKIVGPVHNSLVEEAKDLAAETFVKATEAVERDPIRGINKAQEFILEFQAKMNMYQNTSKILAKLEEPQYGKTYFSSPLFVQGIGTKNFKDIESDQGIVKDAQDSGITIQRINGVPVVATQDFPRFDPSKSFVDWQKNTVSQYQAELGDPTKLGASRRQEILKKVNERDAIIYLEGRASENPSEVFAWWKMHGIDITTDTGRKEAAKRFLYTQEKAQTSRPAMSFNLGGGSLAESAEVSKGTKVGASAALGWRPVAQDDGRFKLQSIFDKNVFVKGPKGGDLSFINKNAAQEHIDKNGNKEFDSATLNVGSETVNLTIPPNEAFAIGEGSSQTSFGQRIESSNVDAKVSRLATVTVSKKEQPVTIGLFTIRKGDVIPNDMLDQFSETEKEPKLFVVAESAPALNFTGAERVSGATIYVPATKDNLNAVIKGIPSGQKELIKKIQKIRDKSETLEGAGPIGAAEKQTGAEAPQSTFNLLDIPTT